MVSFCWEKSGVVAKDPVGAPGPLENLWTSVIRDSNICWAYSQASSNTFWQKSCHCTKMFKDHVLCFQVCQQTIFLKDTTRGLWHPVTLKPKIGKIGILQRSKTKTKKTTILFPLLRWLHVSRKIGPCARLWYGPGPHWHRGPGDIRVAQWFRHLVTW